MESKLQGSSKGIQKQGRGGFKHHRGGFRGGRGAPSGGMAAGINNFRGGFGGSGKGKKKVEIKFDPMARKEFLTGFKKRKDERRQKAREQIKE